MSVKTMLSPIQIPGTQPRIVFKTCDNEAPYFDDLDEAVAHDNKFHAVHNPAPKYEQVWTIQEAINKAVAEHRPVRFLSNLSNEEIKKGIVDIKGCALLKPEKDSKEIAVVPEDLTGTFDFNEVDTSLIVMGGETKC